MRIIDYIKEKQEILVSPIWGGYQEFPFLCLGHLDISEALGFELEQATPLLTIVKEGQMTSLAQLEQWMERKFFDYSVFHHELDRLKQIKEEHLGLMCGGGCFGPLTVVSGILGADKMLRMIARNPELVERFVAYVTEFMIELAVMEREAEQDFFWIAEPLASLLSPERFWKFSGQYLKKIYDAAGVPAFLHVCGPTLKHTPYMVDTGAEVLSIDSCTDIGKCIRMVDEQVVIMGNVNPANLRRGSKEEVVKEVRDILEACKGFPNFIMGTGCSIMAGTPDENMQVLFDLSKEYSL